MSIEHPASLESEALQNFYTSCRRLYSQGIVSKTCVQKSLEEVLCGFLGKHAWRPAAARGHQRKHEKHPEGARRPRWEAGQVRQDPASPGGTRAALRDLVALLQGARCHRDDHSHRAQHRREVQGVGDDQASGGGSGHVRDLGLQPAHEEGKGDLVAQESGPAGLRQ